MRVPRGDLPLGTAVINQVTADHGQYRELLDRLRPTDCEELFSALETLRASMIFMEEGTT